MKFSPDDIADGPDMAHPDRAPALLRWLRALITGWAIAGGFVLLGVAGLTMYGALAKLFLGSGHAYEHELVKYFVGIAIFTFLPYCQMAYGNISVDIFTSGMSERAKIAMSGFGSIFALAFAALMLRQMWLGMESYIRFREITPVLKLPLWTAFPPILFSFALLAVAALITAGESIARFRRPALPKM